MYCVEHPTLYHFTSAKSAAYIVKEGIVPHSVELDGRHCFDAVWLTKNEDFESQRWTRLSRDLQVRFQVNIGGIDDRLFHWNSFKEELGLDSSSLELPEEFFTCSDEETDSWFIFLGEIIPEWLSGAVKNKDFSLTSRYKRALVK